MSVNQKVHHARRLYHTLSNATRACLAGHDRGAVGIGTGLAAEFPRSLSLAVLTAVILTQMSVGKSVKATIIMCWAHWAARFTPDLSPHLFLISAIRACPRSGGRHSAACATRRDKLQIRRRSPLPAAIVVLAPTLTHASSLASATDRVIEVALGGGVALAVSILIFPTRARRLVKERAADMLTWSLISFRIYWEVFQKNLTRKPSCLYCAMLASLSPKWTRSAQKPGTNRCRS